MATIHERVADARKRLREVGIPPDQSDLDARLLAQRLLGWDAARYFAAGGGPEPDGFDTAYESLVARRSTREPIAYITGVREFWGLELEVSPAVLIPRPETELIVEATLELFPSRLSGIAIIDAGTGSGCLAVALAVERPAARIVATDISEAALDVARRNARRHGVADRVRFRCEDLFGSSVDAVDLAVSNPPYVDLRAQPALQPEVRDYEPAVALFAGNGLSMVERVVAEAPARLRSGGYLIFEFGYGQDVEVEDLIAASPDLDFVQLRRDLQGIARTAVARRR
jgi:release factor glutamine methyltransferase